jgi:hypothetical protein
MPNCDLFNMASMMSLVVRAEHPVERLVMGTMVMVYAGYTGVHDLAAASQRAGRCGMCDIGECCLLVCRRAHDRLRSATYAVTVLMTACLLYFLLARATYDARYAYVAILAFCAAKASKTRRSVLPKLAVAGAVMSASALWAGCAIDVQNMLY